MEYYINVFNVTRFGVETHKYIEPWDYEREATTAANTTHDGERYHYMHTLHYVDNKAEIIDLRN